MTDELQDRRHRHRRRWRGLAFAALLVPATAFASPRVLMFPERTPIGDTVIYSVSPVDRIAMAQVLLRADELAREGPLGNVKVGRRVFLTDGGWRWKLLSAGGGGTFGFTRPISDIVDDAVVLNRANIARDEIRGHSGIGGRRTLSGTTAHERAHIAARQRYGAIALVFTPAWLREGLSDVVAQESSLSADDVMKLEETGTRHPALLYYHGRRRVADELAQAGGDVDKMMARHGVRR